ncbi:hypothetical protein WJ969_14670 [Achromobacter xylosoxidans]
MPVALGIVTAFVPACMPPIRAAAGGCFDSVTMFVAFLLTARYLELCARQSFGGSTNGQRHARVEACSACTAGRRRRPAGLALHHGASGAGAGGGGRLGYIDPAHSLPVMVALLVMRLSCAMSMAVPHRHGVGPFGAGGHPSMPDAALDALLAQAGARARQNLHGSWSGTC